MGDNDHFEVNDMQRLLESINSRGEGRRSERLVSLICSDVFGFQDA